MRAYAAERPSTGGEQPTADCAVTYKVDSVWSGGFTATVTVKNTGPAAVEGWQLTWSYAGGQRVTSAWNATVTQRGADVVAQDAGWNRSIAPGATVGFGIQGSLSGSNPSPTAFALNAGACD